MLVQHYDAMLALCCAPLRCARDQRWAQEDIKRASRNRHKVDTLFCLHLKPLVTFDAYTKRHSFEMFNIICTTITTRTHKREEKINVEQSCLPHDSFNSHIELFNVTAGLWWIYIKVCATYTYIQYIWTLREPTYLPWVFFFPDTVILCIKSMKNKQEI